MTEPNALAAARAVARKAYWDTPPDGDPVEAILDAYTSALAAAGLLVSGEPDERTAVKLAQWLAAKSNFARYRDEGWRLLLESDIDVALAYQKATTFGPGPDPREPVRAGLAEARDLLLRYVAARQECR